MRVDRAAERVWCMRTEAGTTGPWTIGFLQSLVRRKEVGPETLVGRSDTGVYLPAREWMSLIPVLAEMGHARPSQAQESPRPAPEPQRRPLIDWAPPMRPDPAGNGFATEWVKPGLSFIARCVGEPLEVLMHYDSRSGLRACMGVGCKHCPDQRRRYAYLHVLRIKSGRGGEPEVYDAIQAIPPVPAAALRGLLPLRGKLLGVTSRGGRSPTQVDVLQQECPYPLPEPLDPRVYLIRKWELSEWPDQNRSVRQPDENILQFRRKQA